MTECTQKNATLCTKFSDTFSAAFGLLSLGSTVNAYFFADIRVFRLPIECKSKLISKITSARQKLMKSFVFSSEIKHEIIPKKRVLFIPFRFFDN